MINCPIAAFFVRNNWIVMQIMTSANNIGRKNNKSLEDEVDENTNFNPANFLSITYNENENTTNRNAERRKPPTEKDNFHSTLDNDAEENDYYSILQKRNPRVATLQASSHQSHNKRPINLESDHYSCTFCDKYFIQKHLLRRHMKLHSSNVENNDRDLVVQLSKEIKKGEVDGNSAEKLYFCDICGIDCKCKSFIAQHKKIHKTQETKSLSCPICEKVFKFNSLLINHVESHKTKVKIKKSLSCHICGKKYTKIGSLNKHELQHEGKGTFRCRPCGEMFTTEAERTKHRDEKHEKPWKCEICSHMFATKEKLNTHLKWHESKETEVFICNVCGKEFKLKVNLKVHVESRCGTDPQHVCNVCGKAFMTRGTLSNATQIGIHEKHTTKNKSSPIMGHMNPVEPQKPVNDTVIQDVVPTISGSYYNYRNSNYDENHDWISPIYGNSEQTIDQIPAIVDRFHQVSDFHPSNIERNMKTMQSFGVGSAVSKEPKSDTRCLPYPCSSDGLLAYNGKSFIGNFFQNFDNHRVQNYQEEKYSHDSRLQNSYTSNEKYSCNPKVTPDVFQPIDFKTLESVAQNTISPLKDSVFNTISSCGNPVSQSAVLASITKKNNSSDDIASVNDAVFIGSHFTVDGEGSNVKSEDFHLNQKNNISEPIPGSEHQQNDELSNFGSPINNDSETDESENETTSKMSLDQSTYIKSETENAIETKATDNKISSTAETSQKMPHDRKQKYPAKCDVIVEQLETDSACKFSASKPQIQFSCDLCKLIFAQENLLNEHIQSHKIQKEDEKSIDTDEDEPLNKRLQRILGKLNENSSDIVPKKFPCQYCNEHFDHVSHLNRHRKSHSLDEKAATPCRHCGKKYTNKACLIKHESQHISNGIFKCGQCGDGFNSKQEYRSHRTKQHGKQWSCSECQRSFSNSSNLKNHYNNKHLGREAKSYACNICGKLFKQKGNLKVHVDSRCGSEPRHVCNICGKAFMSGGSLGTHLLLHTGEKTFLCRFCGKSYRLKVEMQRHERSHTGEKPFVCKVCNKAFAHRESLVTHNTLHTGIRPYMCEACGSTFSCIGNLIKHRQTHNRRCDVT
ncbi:hypothetical protein C0J52_18471 [Blattella germanica]|nr:hypothetical protein C0J52_18471 [Blattella germanica]